jgi:tRNA nucleotidyltransferase (CCA-adding enzyme)
MLENQNGIETGSHHMIEQPKESYRIPSSVRAAMKRLRECGYEAYLVGGAVRDYLLGGLPADFDLATDATPEQVIEAFSEHTCIPTGIAHGTVTILINGRPLEITTYRVDGAYTDSRRPETVEFSRSLAEDVAMLDFTINALAMSEDGEIVDYVGGRMDLSNHVIRAVGDPDRRMREDALRILRALRFSAVLGFPIEENTRRSLFCRACLCRTLRPFVRRVRGSDSSVLYRNSRSHHARNHANEGLSPT